VSITGIDVQPNKAIVGRNAFAHEAGIHQDGVLKDARTYEIMTPESVGLARAHLVLGKHSGRHAFAKRLQGLGYELTKEQVAGAFVRFKELSDKKKDIFDEDLVAILEQEILTVPEIWSLDYLATTSGTRSIPTATVVLRRGEELFQDSATGDGPVDAAYRAVDRITGLTGTLLSYGIRAVTSGKDALGEANIKVQFEGGREISARAASTDIVESSVRAYLAAANRMLAMRGESRTPGGDQP
jgi:2-isopropylmalate synthase